MSASIAEHSCCVLNLAADVDHPALRRIPHTDHEPLYGSDIQQALDYIADGLRIGVSLDDLTGRLIAYSAQHGVDDACVRAVLHHGVPPADIREWQERHGTATAVKPVVIPANADLGMSARLCVPLIAGGVRTGLLCLLASEAVPVERLQQHLDTIGDQTELLAATLYELASPHLDERRQRERDFIAACRGDTDALGLIGEIAAVRSATTLRIAVSIFSTADAKPLSQSRAAQLRLSAQQAVSRYPGVIASSVQGTHTVVLLRPDRDANSAGRLHQQLSLSSRHSRDATTDRLCTGISQTSSGVEDLPRTYRRAVVAAQTSAVEPLLGDAIDWADIGAYQLIAGPMKVGDSLPSDRLSALLAADTTGSLTDTLEVLYDKGENVQAAAEELHVHRTSLYYRLNRIREILGVDPLLGSVRLELHLALKVRRWSRRPLV